MKFIKKLFLIFILFFNVIVEVEVRKSKTLASLKKFNTHRIKSSTLSKMDPISIAAVAVSTVTYLFSGIMDAFIIEKLESLKSNADKAEKNINTMQKITNINVTQQCSKFMQLLQSGKILIFPIKLSLLTSLLVNLDKNIDYSIQIDEWDPSKEVHDLEKKLFHYHQKEKKLISHLNHVGLLQKSERKSKIKKYTASQIFDNLNVGDEEIIKLYLSTKQEIEKAISEIDRLSEILQKQTCTSNYIFNKNVDIEIKAIKKLIDETQKKIEKKSNTFFQKYIVKYSKKLFNGIKKGFKTFYEFAKDNIEKVIDEIGYHTLDISKNINSIYRFRTIEDEDETDYSEGIDNTLDTLDYMDSIREIIKKAEEFGKDGWETPFDISKKEDFKFEGSTAISVLTTLKSFYNFYVNKKEYNKISKDDNSLDKYNVKVEYFMSIKDCIFNTSSLATSIFLSGVPGLNIIGIVSNVIDCVVKFMEYRKTVEYVNVEIMKLEQTQGNLFYQSMIITKENNFRMCNYLIDFSQFLNQFESYYSNQHADEINDLVIYNDAYMNKLTEAKNNLIMISEDNIKNAFSNFTSRSIINKILNETEKNILHEKLNNGPINEIVLCNSLIEVKNFIEIGYEMLIYFDNSSSQYIQYSQLPDFKDLKLNEISQIKDIKSINKYRYLMGCRGCSSKHYISEIDLVSYRDIENNQDPNKMYLKKIHEELLTNKIEESEYSFISLDESYIIYKKENFNNKKTIDKAFAGIFRTNENIEKYNKIIIPTNQNVYFNFLIGKHSDSIWESSKDEIFFPKLKKNTRYLVGLISSELLKKIKSNRNISKTSFVLSGMIKEKYYLLFIDSLNEKTVENYLLSQKLNNSDLTNHIIGNTIIINPKLYIPSVVMNIEAENAESFYFQNIDEVYKLGNKEEFFIKDVNNKNIIKFGIYNKLIEHSKITKIDIQKLSNNKTEYKDMICKNNICEFNEGYKKPNWTDNDDVNISLPKEVGDNIILKYKSKVRRDLLKYLVFNEYKENNRIPLLLTGDFLNKLQKEQLLIDEKFRNNDFQYYQINKYYSGLYDYYSDTKLCPLSLYDKLNLNILNKHYLDLRSHFNDDDRNSWEIINFTLSETTNEKFMSVGNEFFNDINKSISNKLKFKDDDNIFKQCNHFVFVLGFYLDDKSVDNTSFYNIYNIPNTSTISLTKKINGPGVYPVIWVEFSYWTKDTDKIKLDNHFNRNKYIAQRHGWIPLKQNSDQDLSKKDSFIYRFGQKELEYKIFIKHDHQLKMKKEEYCNSKRP